MKRITITIVLNLLTFLAVSAQKINVIEASSQNWAGGICCRYGINYHFKIQFANFRRGPIPDTIWINGRDFALSPISKDGPGNLNIEKQGCTYTITFNPGFTNDDFQRTNVTSGGEVTPRPVIKPAPKKYTGAALLSYHLKGRKKRYFYVLSEIKSEPPLNYP